VQSMAHKSRLVEEMMNDLLGVFQVRTSHSLFPLLQPAIGVGSTFEGWSPCGQDTVYHLLVPLKPPRGHAFHLEMGTAGKMPAESYVRVVPECTCMGEQCVKNRPCFVHQPRDPLRRKQNSSILSTLCTDSYLDARKIALWFQNSVSSAWKKLPQSRRYTLEVLPSRRSCKLQLKNASGRSFLVEMVFGVQQGDSDIFLSSQTTEASFTPSTTWAESYAVAETKFFSHIAKQAPHDTFHLKCLQLCAGILVGTGFSTYALKTVVMHLLSTTPLAIWNRREFLLRLQDIMRYFQDSVEEKCLHHFFFGNKNMPKDIILPPAFQEAEPLNLFQCLVQDPTTHTNALQEFQEL
ncbi:IPIL1 protein, partial [Rostratula benghalensis]|nr:IPIL1 protein [Rostratula benghalensis]